MTDLFSAIPPRKLKVGQANGEFLIRLADMLPGNRAMVKPSDFPDATARFVKANAAFHGSAR